MCPWAVFVFVSSQDSLRRALRKNRTRQQDETLNVVQFNPSTTKFVDFEAKARKAKWMQSSLAKDIWKDNAKCRLNKSAKEEIKILVTILSDKNRFKWEIPIAHTIPKEPDCESWGDACLTGGGGFSSNANFWWETKWPEDTAKRTLKFFSTKKKKRQQKDGHANDGLIDTNSLEHAVMIVNHAASAQAHKENTDENKSPQPVMLNHADDTSAKAWTRKAAKHSKGAKALNRILARLMMNQNLGINAQFIEGTKNVLADCISRVHEKNSFLDFKKLKQELPQLESS